MCPDSDKDSQQHVKTIFLSGSRGISRLNEDIRTRIQNIINNGFQVIVGDANGADKALQKLLADSKYRNVKVFCAANICRNNIGEWKVQNVQVDAKLKGCDFYTQKDKEMASKADYGLVLWDGKSAGSISNVFELLKMHKTAVVYFSPEKKFYNIKKLQDAQDLLNRCDEESIGSIKKKIKLSTAIKNVEAASQGALGF
jgi:hypothetical protein